MRVLIAEDDAASRKLLESLVTHWGHQVIVARDGAAAAELLQSDTSVDLVLLDWMMPKVSGVDVVKQLRASDRRPRPHVIMLSARTQTADVVAALDAGADDYVVKPVESPELAARLRVAERALYRQAELLRAVEAKNWARTHDALTGVLTRGAALDRVEELTRAQPFETLTVLVVDVDEFRALNELSGPRTGDVVLREVARRVSEVAPDDSVVGRYGADELIVLSTSLTPGDAAALGERMRAAVAGSAIATPSGALAVTVSVGVSFARHVEARDLGWLLCAVDTQTAAARNLGGNRVERRDVDSSDLPPA